MASHRHVQSLVEASPDRLIELAEGFRSGRLAPADYLGKLERLFAEREPGLQAFIQEPDRFERLREDLAALEAAHPEPPSRPPLYGVPVGVKDIFHVDGFRTQAGSRLPPDVLKGTEAASVTALKRAGALVLGKTVTTEFAYFAPGPTRNPHDLGRTPGGSSSGSAAAVAAGLVPLALGTQTIASTSRPASYCGVVGFKPSFGRVPLDGVIPLSPSADHIGIFTAHPEGIPLAASALCEDWDAEAEPLPLVFGVPEGPYLEKAGGECLAHFRKACSRLTGAGVRIEPVELFEDFDELVERHNDLVAVEAAAVHRDLFRNFKSIYHRKTADLIVRGSGVPPDRHKACRVGRKELRGALRELMGRHGLSGWLAPAAVGPAPEGLDSTGDPVMSLPWTHAGLPTVSLPCGTLDGLPVGLQVVGPWTADEALAGAAVKLAGILGPGREP